jgi:hypothetical protein
MRVQRSCAGEICLCKLVGRLRKRTHLRYLISGLTKYESKSHSSSSDSSSASSTASFSGGQPARQCVSLLVLACLGRYRCSCAVGIIPRMCRIVAVLLLQCSRIRSITGFTPEVFDTVWSLPMVVHLTRGRAPEVSICLRGLFPGGIL